MERAGDRSVSAIYRVDDSTGLARPLFECSLSAGFPSPADGDIEDRIDLNREMILHPDATYYARISGDSMIGEGLWDGSLVAFNRALTALDGDIVVASSITLTSAARFTATVTTTTDAFAWKLPISCTPRFAPQQAQSFTLSGW